MRGSAYVRRDRCVPTEAHGRHRR